MNDEIVEIVNPAEPIVVGTDAAKKRGLRKTRKGVVISKSGEKTVVVRVERRYKHPLYGKILRDFNKCHTHDEENKAKVGDKVIIMETRPLSKMKRWRLVEVEA